MRDRDRRAALDEIVKCSLDLLLGLRVDARSRLVENQDARIDEERARDADPLPLAARESLSTFADETVVPVRKTQDELVRPRGARGGDDLLARRAGPSDRKSVV